MRIAPIRRPDWLRPPAKREPPYDRWLERKHGDLLRGIESDAEARPDAGVHALFGAIADDELWMILLWKQYDNFPAIRAALPDFPEPEFQEHWVGGSGMRLARETCGFYRTVKHAMKLHGGSSLSDATLLDFGCGWGRHLRFFAKDVPPNRLYGCDSNKFVLQMCEELRVPGRLGLSRSIPQSVPVEGPLDLAYAFSVFTHLSERTHRAALAAIHAALVPGGLLVVTLRPPGYLGEGGPREAAGFKFVPHDIPPEDGEITYGDTVITTDYVERNWAPMFDLLEVEKLRDDPDQTVVVVQKR
jgi:SAM-dependent methyltransferase